MKKCSKKTQELEKRPFSQISKPTPFSSEVQELEKKRKLSASIKMDIENIALRMLHSKTQFDNNWLNNELKTVVSFSDFYKATTVMEEKNVLKDAILNVSDEISILSTNEIKKYENFVSESKKVIQNVKVSPDSTEFDKTFAEEKKIFIAEIRKIKERITGDEKIREADGSIPADATHAVSYDDLIDRKEELRLERLLLEFKEKFLA